VIAVHDGIVPDPQAYRQMALAQAFRAVDVGHAVFDGIAPAPETAAHAWLAAVYPTFTPTLSFFRKSPEGQEEPNFIHTDVDMGDATVILYLNDPPADGDGTSFWRHRDCGARVGGLMSSAAGKDLSAWECWRTVDAAFNRAVLFQAGCFHSRAIRANYGQGDAARLIQVVFGQWEGR
jgi:hypothetical protein